MTPEAQEKVARVVLGAYIKQTHDDGTVTFAIGRRDENRSIRRLPAKEPWLDPRWLWPLELELKKRGWRFDRDCARCHGENGETIHLAYHYNEPADVVNAAAEIEAGLTTEEGEDG